MPASQVLETTLTLRPVAGPPLEPIRVPSERRTVLGRSASCDVVLPDESVSRRHLAILHREHQWLVADLASRHGTTVNAMPLAADTLTPLEHRDLVHVGPWTLRVEMEPGPSGLVPTTDDAGTAGRRVEPVRIDPHAHLAQNRLEALIDCAAALTSAADETALAEAVLASTLSGTGYHRAALLRLLERGERVDVLGFRSRTGQGTEDASFSRSLLRAAAGGRMVRLTSEEQPPLGHSIVQLGIASALCAPIHVGGAVDAVLYLDTRAGEQAVDSDASGFCQVVARLAGLALANLRRVQLEQRQHQLETEVRAARLAQELITPAESGRVGGLHYAARVRPGSLVAGDLFDVVALEDGRVATLIGDVCGEGIGASVIMAATQSHVRALLARGADPADAVGHVNRYLSAHTAPGKFVSLWLGVFDLERGELTYVDAGHGHWLHRPAGGASRHVPHRGGIVLGIDADAAHPAETLAVQPGDRIILYSDGVIEQPAPGGEPFGNERLVRIVDESASSAEDVESALAAVIAFAGRDHLADDTTVASVEWMAPPAG